MKGITIVILLIVYSFCFVKPDVDFEAKLTGAAMVPPVQTQATATADLEYDSDDLELSWDIDIEGIEKKDITAANIYGPATEEENADILITLKNQTDSIKGKAKLTEQQASYLTSGLLYIVVRSNAHPDGEIRGQIRTLATRFIADLSGSQEVPPNESTASGSAVVDFDYDSLEMHVEIEHTATSNVRAIHIHGPGAIGTNGPVLFVLNSTSSSASETLTLTELQKNYLRDGLIYINVHTDEFPDGEVRGQLLIDMDDPYGNNGTWLLLLSVLAGLVILSAIAIVVALGVFYFFKREQIHDFLRKRKFDKNHGEALLDDDFDDY